MSYIPRPFYLYRLLQFFALDAKVFLNENHHASRGGHFKNASEARVSTSFARKLQSIFGNVDSSASAYLRLQLTPTFHEMIRIV